MASGSDDFFIISGLAALLYGVAGAVLTLNVYVVAIEFLFPL